LQFACQELLCSLPEHVLSCPLDYFFTGCNSGTLTKFHSLSELSWSDEKGGSVNATSERVNQYLRAGPVVVRAHDRGLRAGLEGCTTNGGIGNEGETGATSEFCSCQGSGHDHGIDYHVASSALGLTEGIEASLEVFGQLFTLGRR